MRRKHFRLRFRFSNLMIGTFGASFVALSGLSFMAGVVCSAIPAAAPVVPATVQMAVVTPAAPHITRVAYVIPADPPKPKPAPVKARFAFTWVDEATPAVPTKMYGDLIQRAAFRHAVPVELVEAIVRVESDFDPLTVSHKGALGLMQVMPTTGERFGVNREELFNPERNLEAGAAYISWLLTRYNDLDLALAAYNAGEGAVEKYRGIPPYRETQQYVRRVKRALFRDRA